MALGARQFFVSTFSLLRLAWDKDQALARGRKVMSRRSVGREGGGRGWRLHARVRPAGPRVRPEE